MILVIAWFVVNILVDCIWAGSKFHGRQVWTPHEISHIICNEVAQYIKAYTFYDTTSQDGDLNVLLFWLKVIIVQWLTG